MNTTGWVGVGGVAGPTGGGAGWVPGGVDGLEGEPGVVGWAALPVTALRSAPWAFLCAAIIRMIPAAAMKNPQGFI